ncbi:MAG: aspartate-semialdehyde dehydrogenase [Nitrososphaerota archaeon]|nr:aspartate-semialdehyde dehydrogenase [Nitrososphaerota archaeon]
MEEEQTSREKFYNKPSTYLASLGRFGVQSSKKLKRIDVAVLGATGKVGIEYLEMLKNHPWFRVVEATGNTKVGMKLGEVVPDLPSSMRSIEIKESDPSKIESKFVFSPLPTAVAKETESKFAQSGFKVITDASPHRMDKDVPLMIPEINPDHLKLIESRLKKKQGFIVATPNCTTIGLAITLKPLNDSYSVKKVVMTSFQALSGAGYPGVPSLDIQENVIPYISGEEEKVTQETNKLLGSFSEDRIRSNSIDVYCSCNRVAVIDGHLESVYLETKDSLTDPEGVLRSFRGVPQELKLPSAPKDPIVVTKENDRPQPRLDRMAGNGMTTVVGRVRQSGKRVLQYHLLTHNTIRGAAGGAILTAELLCKQYDIA